MLHFTSVNLHSFISRPVLASSWFYDFSWDIFSGSRVPRIGYVLFLELWNLYTHWMWREDFEPALLRRPTTTYPRRSC